jgi:hypothetical protein
VSHPPPTQFSLCLERHLRARLALLKRKALAPPRFRLASSHRAGVAIPKSNADSAATNRPLIRLPRRRNVIPNITTRKKSDFRMLIRKSLLKMGGPKNSRGPYSRCWPDPVPVATMAREIKKSIQ